MWTCKRIKNEWGNLVMFELIYGNYNDMEERDIYEDIDDARADAIKLSQSEDYDFVILKDIDNDEEIFTQYN